MSKIILVTGTSAGLGISIAVQAAQAGHTVYASMRNLEKRAGLDAAAEAAGVSLTVLPLDVQNSASVTATVAEVMAREGRIDVLINNAGAGYVRSTEQAPEAEIEWVTDVNYMGVVRCTKAVLPHMRKQRSGHIIAITSVGGLVGQPFNEFYCAAKFAVEGYFESLATYVSPNFGIDFTCVEPGGIRTEFANSVLKQIGATGGMLEDEYLPVLQDYIASAQNRQGTDGGYQTADQVAAVVMRTLHSDEPPIRVRTADWAEELTRLKTGLDPKGKELKALVIKRSFG